MIRLTVLYNLPPGSDEDEFLRWRLGDHQKANESSPGVLYTDFALVGSQWTPDDASARPPYRFMTIAEWPDRESFERAFLTEEAQAELREDLKRGFSDMVFLVSEVLASSKPNR